MDEQELLQIVTRLRKLEVKGREVKTEVDGIRALLRDEFEARGTNEVKAGRYRVRRIVYDREQFDAKKFREQQPTAYKLYSKPTTVSKIEVVG